MSKKNNIALVGFMGTGKSAVAKELSKRLKAQYIEMDSEIEKSEKMKINDMFSEKGEEYFRNLETKLLEGLVKQENKIISCGGGVVLRSENIELLKNYCNVVLLTCCSQNIHKRINGDQSRPILNNNMTVEYIEKLQKIREPFYEKAADIIIDTNCKSVTTVTEEIISKVKGY